jgi:ArsR family transcriptional regulator
MNTAAKRSRLVKKSPPAESFCAQQLKVLADDTRLSVLRLLMKGPKRVGELNDVLGLDQSLLSHHLKTLRHAGLVEATRDGKAVLYRLAPNVQGTSSGEAINLGCCQLSFD